MPSSVNRKPTKGGSQIKAVRFSTETLTAIEQIIAAFQTKYPNGLYPNLTHLLQIACERYINEVGQDPKMLAAEVKDFQVRYANLRRKPNSKKEQV